MAKQQSSEEVVILMAVFNGALDLPEQLDSFVRQTHESWSLIASDDGSSDNSLEVLNDFANGQRKNGRKVEIISGAGKGFVVNFLSLIEAATETAQWVAISDQDDVWLPERLSMGLSALQAVPDQTPSLYCSQTWVVDQNLQNRRPSTRFTKPSCFRNALVQNIVPGNTILLNRKAFELVRAAAAKAKSVRGLPAHDWLMYQLVTGAGGTVIRDERPTLLYRQHGANQIGANDSWAARIKRIRQLFSGHFRSWISANTQAVHQSRDALTDDHRRELDLFIRMREAPVISRILAARKIGVYRQSFFGQLALWAAICSIPDDHIDPRRSALFMARSILNEVRDGRSAC